MIGSRDGRRDAVRRFQVRHQQVERHDLEQIGDMAAPKDRFDTAVPMGGGDDQVRMKRRPLFDQHRRQVAAPRDGLDRNRDVGALGLEAASRGAASVTLVEKNAAAAAICRRNADAVTRAARSGARPHVDVRASSVQSALATATGPFDLVFLDPPYDLGDAELLAALQALVPLLAEDATVCIERSTRDGEPTLPPGLELLRTKTYGETAVHYAIPA